MQIRRCTTCRLRRCFQVGMKEELVRTEEENQRHKQLVTTNRKRRELLRQHKKDNDHHHSPQVIRFCFCWLCLASRKKIRFFFVVKNRHERIIVSN